MKLLKYLLMSALEGFHWLSIYPDLRYKTQQGLNRVSYKSPVRTVLARAVVPNMPLLTFFNLLKSIPSLMMSLPRIAVLDAPVATKNSTVSRIRRTSHRDRNNMCCLKNPRLEKAIASQSLSSISLVVTYSTAISL
jgi:hypothetical protein